MRRTSGLAVAGLALLVAAAAQAAVVTTYYGDDDGFGIGATAGSIDPSTSHAGAGEAPYTDERLIGGAFAFPAFKPTGSFGAFTVPAGNVIVGATLTMRAGSWVNGSPVQGPNQMLLDGAAVPESFFDLFINQDDYVEMRSMALDPSFYPLFADGNVSLNGTVLSEKGGEGSFQIDFLRLDLDTEIEAVPEPSSLALCGLGVFALVRRRRQRG